MTKENMQDVVVKALQDYYADESSLEDATISKGFNVIFINLPNGQEFSVHIVEQQD